MNYDSILKMVKQKNPDYNLTYQDILVDIKKQNPQLSHKEAQKQASKKFKDLQAEAEKKAQETYDKFEKARDELKTEPLSKSSKAKNDKTTIPDLQAEEGEIKGQQEKKIEIPQGVSVDELFAAEKKIRKAGPNRNTIIAIGREVMPNGKLVINGQDGPNKLVTFEDDEGNCIPISGNFKIFLVC